MEQQRFIRLPEVKSVTGLSRSTIYSLVGNGNEHIRRVERMQCTCNTIAKNSMGKCGISLC